MVYKTPSRVFGLAFKAPGTRPADLSHHSLRRPRPSPVDTCTQLKEQLQNSLPAASISI